MTLKVRGLLAALVCVAGLIAPTAPVQAAPTIGGGDCWRSGTPQWCRGTYAPDQYLRIYTLDRFSDVRPNWSSAYSSSNSTWTSSPGPQILATYRRSRDSWVFYEDSATGRDGLQSTNRGITWHCDYGSYCSPFNEPMYVKFSSIKLNVNVLPNDSGHGTTSTFAHETGHALGLVHHTRTTDLMYPSYHSGRASGPTADNAGVLPPCSGSSTTSNASNTRAGVRCVYKWKT